MITKNQKIIILTSDFYVQKYQMQEGGLITFVEDFDLSKIIPQSQVYMVTSHMQDNNTDAYLVTNQKLILFKCDDIFSINNCIIFILIFQSKHNQNLKKEKIFQLSISMTNTYSYQLEMKDQTYILSMQRFNSSTHFC